MERVSNTGNTVKTMYLMGIPAYVIKKSFWYDFSSYRKTKVFDGSACDILRDACMLRSMLLRFNLNYVKAYNTGASLDNAVPYKYLWLLDALMEFELEDIWDSDGVYATVNALSNIINDRDYVLKKVGIERYNEVFNALFYLPQFTRQEFDRVCDTYTEKFRDLPYNMGVPHPELWEGLPLTWTGDEDLYLCVNRLIEHSTDGVMPLYDVSKDYAGQVIHYIDGENQHPFHIIQVANAAPEKHLVKLFYEADSGVEKSLDARCEKHKVERVTYGKSQVDQALMMNIAKDQPDVAIIHSGDSDYYQTILMYHDTIKFVVVTRENSISPAYITQLKELGVEIYRYSDTSFSTIDIEPIVRQKTKQLLLQSALEQWNVDELVAQVSNDMYLRRERVEELVTECVSDAQNALEKAIG